MPAPGTLTSRTSEVMKPGALSPRQLAPLFVIIALINAAAVATRFDLLAAKLPAGAALGIMLAVVPLLVLGGYFEGRIDYGATLADLPLWMRIKSVPVKLAFTFGFIYLTCVALQTWNVNIGPLDPTPPASFPPGKRAMWFAMFTGGMFFPFYLAATSLLIPGLRGVTWPLRKLPAFVGGLVAIVVGAGAGVLVLAAVTSSQLGAFVGAIRDTYKAHPVAAIGISLAATLVPLAVGIVRDRE
jgi:hypothetical protein